MKGVQDVVVSPEGGDQNSIACGHTRDFSAALSPGEAANLAGCLQAGLWSGHCVSCPRGLISCLARVGAAHAAALAGGYSFQLLSQGGECILLPSLACPGWL